MNMPSGPAPATRREGACLQCKKIKRKCDQQHPQCSQCQRRGLPCSLQVFKVQTIESTRFRTQKRRPRASKGSAATATATATAASPLGKGLEGFIFGQDCLPADPFSSSSGSSQATPPAYDISPETFQEDDTAVITATQDLPLLFDDQVSPLEVTNSTDPAGEWHTNLSFSANQSKTMTQQDTRDWRHVTPTDESLAVAPLYRGSVEGLVRRSFTLDHIGTQLQQPSPVLNSTVRRLLWDYLTNKGLEVFLCWEPHDTRLDRRYNDPYKDHLPAVALASRPMMLASLALSAFHFGGEGPDRQDDSLVASLMLEASRALAASHRHQPQKAEEFLSTIGTASFLYLLKPDVYADMLPLSRSAALCLLTNPKWQNIGQPSYQAIMQIFRWLDICAQCSLKKFVPVPDEYTQLCLEVRENERAADLSSAYASWFVHPLYAFSEDLITPLRRIAWLIRLRQQKCIEVPEAEACPKSPSSSLEILANCATIGSSNPVRISSSRFNELVDETERAIQMASGRVLSIRRDHGSRHRRAQAAPDLRTELERLATAIDSAVVILFYTRLRDMPWTSSLVRFHVRNVVESISGIASSSRFANGIVFPLFMAGLEAADLSDRAMIAEKIRALPGIWSHRENKMVACLKHVWELRDANPDSVWSSWIYQVSTDCEDVIPA